MTRVAPRESPHLRCAYCHGAGPALVGCQGCGALLHAGCRREARACPTLGCAAGGAPELDGGPFVPARPASGLRWTHHADEVRVTTGSGRRALAYARPALVFALACAVFVGARAALAVEEPRELDRTIDAACRHGAWGAGAMAGVSALIGLWVGGQVTAGRVVTLILVLPLLAQCAISGAVIQVLGG